MVIGYLVVRKYFNRKGRIKEKKVMFATKQQAKKYVHSFSPSQYIRGFRCYEDGGMVEIRVDYRDYYED